MTEPKKPKPHAPSDLTMSLFAPGMTTIHRAGLGGLGSTLRYIEQAFSAGILPDEQVPGSPWLDGNPPWSISPQEIVLRFGEPAHAEEFLKRLFAIAFDLRDGLIYLPGQYGDVPPPFEVRAEIQLALAKLTFLQHGLVRKLEKEQRTYNYDPDGSGRFVQVDFQLCHWYKHRDGWKDLTQQGCVSRKQIEVVGPLNPGAMVRHNQFPSRTKIEDTVERILPLYFALIGCLALSVNRGVGVLIIPDVDDLLAFARNRRFLTPSNARQCRIASLGDAALQAQSRLRAHGALRQLGSSSCIALKFMSTPWASQQKSRVESLHVEISEDRLRDFEMALMHLPPRVVTPKAEQKTKRGKRGSASEIQYSYWADSIVRPFVANNLAVGNRWYAGFSQLLVKSDPVSKKPIRDKLLFERKGLHAMTENLTKNCKEDAIVLQAVHEALRNRYGQIADENKSNLVAMKNRWAREYDRWRIAFANSKTPDQFRFALCDLLSRAGGNRVLKLGWREFLPMLRDDWQRTRDLSLVALCSYGGQASEGDEPQS